MINNDQNIITVSEDLINRALRQKILQSSAGAYVEDFQITFSGGHIYLELDLQIQTLGELIAKYRFEVVDLTFKPGTHILLGDYIEDVQATGGFAQSMMLKAVGLKDGTFLQTIVKMTNPSGVKVDATSCAIDLEQFLNLDNNLFSILTIKYLACTDGMLQLTYQLDL